MDKLNAQLRQLNKINISGDADTDLDISIYWFRALSNVLTRYDITPRTHHHTFFEIHFIINGSVTYDFDNDKNPSTVEKNEFIIISPMQRHRVVSVSDDFIKVSLGFSLPDTNTLYQALTKQNAKLSVITPPIKSCLDFAFYQAEQGECYSPVLIKNRLLEIICLIAGHVKQHSKTAKSSEYTEIDERLLKAKKYINDNTGLFLSCNDVATYCHISEKQLARIFKKYENVSLLSYIHNCKLKQAKKLLSDSNKTLCEISREIGFSNEYYFNRFFTSHAGMTPGDYRKTYPEN